MKKLLIAFLWVLPLSAAETPLDEQLSNLAVPQNRAPVGVSGEKLYSVQTRYSPLKHRSEVSVGSGMNVSIGDFVSSNQMDLTYRFHLTDRWNVALSGSYVFNKLSSSGQRLLEDEGRLPDVAYAKYRAELLAGYNLFYGKFRVSMDQVFYFDQYVALGPGLIQLSQNSSIAAVADIGFAFWWGRFASLRIGIKDYLFKERRIKSEGIANAVVPHIELGIMLGGV